MAVIPRVSVVMPVWNGSRWLAEAIESIISQTYTQWELLILDDGSTDSSVAVAETFSDSRIRLIRRPHEGLIKTLNAGLDLARGDWIARLDADDVVAPNWIETQLSLAAQDPDIVLMGGAYFEERAAGWRAVNLPEDDIVIRWRLLFSNVIMHPGAMYSRKAAVEIGGYDPKMEVAEDYDLWWRLGRLGKYATVPDVVVRRRMHSESVSVKRRDVQLGTIVRILEREIEGILGVKPPSEMVRSILNVQGWHPYYPLELSRGEVWTFIFGLYAAVRKTASPEERVILDQSELPSLVRGAKFVLNTGVACEVRSVKTLYTMMKSMAPQSFSWGQRIRYGVIFGLPVAVLSRIRALRAALRQVSGRV